MCVRRYLLIGAMAVALVTLLTWTEAWAEEFRVGMKNWLFTPKEIQIKEGDMVVWINDDDSHHKVLFKDPSVAGSENIKPGREYRKTFDKSGVYPYYCKYHDEYGMTGTVNVIEAGSKP